MVDLTSEQRQLAKIVHDNDDAQLLRAVMTIWMPLNGGWTALQKSRCLQYPGYFALQNGSKGWLRALLMESLRYRKITKSNGPEISAVPA